MCRLTHAAEISRHDSSGLLFGMMFADKDELDVGWKKMGPRNARGQRVGDTDKEDVAVRELASAMALRMLSKERRFIPRS